MSAPEREAVLRRMHKPMSMVLDRDAHQAENEAMLDAYAATIASRVRAECGQAAREAETKRADVMGEAWEAGRAMGRRETDAEWRARVEGAVGVMREAADILDANAKRRLLAPSVICVRLRASATALLTAVARDREGTVCVKHNAPRAGCAECRAEYQSITPTPEADRAE